jgi:3-deoxy-D-manno-octulosonic-acid transferase
LKFDATPNEAQLEQGRAFKTAQNNPARLVIALASTREDEEVLLLTQLKSWLGTLAPQPLLLLIPRHPKRASELVKLLSELEFIFCQRSCGETPQANTQVYLCDSLGEMWFYYGASDIAVVGGGWLPYGGQNLIEPSMAGCAVVVGPHMFNFAHATSQALQSQAVIQCSSAQELTHALNGLLSSDKRHSLTAQARRFALAHAGATNAHMVLIERYLDP